MNYERERASKRHKKITSKSTQKKKRFGVRFFKGILLILVILILAGVAGGFVFLKKVLDNSPEITPDDVRPSSYTTFVYADDKKTEIEKFVGSGSNRIYESIDHIPKHLQHAFVAIEDERFYKHKGIDPKGILRAGIIGIKNGGHFTEGASTITQQLIKNNVFPDFVSEDTFAEKVERKIQEQFLALNIEKQMSKNEILESYMNTINLGEGCLGVQAAAKRYFNKDVSELNLSESAVIASITQNPTAYNPVLYPDENKVRRDKVLGNMMEQGYINQKECDEAIADDVYARIQDINAHDTTDSPYSYFVDALSDQIIDDLQSNLGYTEAQAYNALYSGGLTVYSTQDLELQKICDEEANKDSNYPSLKEYGLTYALTVTRADGTVENYSSGHIKKYVQDTYNKEQGLIFPSEESARNMIEEWKSTIAQEGDTYDEVVNITPQPQASITLMDQYTGEIKAMVGGRGTKTTSLSLNRAYKGSPEQPGSCFKIIATYAPALDACDKTLATIIRDEPWHYSNGTPFKNATNHYMGDITMRTAIAHSQNVCAVKMINEITPQLGYKYAEKFGFTTLDDDDKSNESIALGGLKNGVYNYQLCAAYASIANGGVYNRPTLYSKILDHDGHVLLENNPDSRTVLKESTAALLTSAMESVVTEGTGRAVAMDDMPVAGKTGTTDNNVDLWFCGYTPYYTCAVWGGYDENKSLTDIDTVFRYRLWKNIMERVHKSKHLAKKEFKMPDSVVKKTVCTRTGLLANSGCPAVTEYFDAETAPTKYCNGHGFFNNRDRYRIPRDRDKEKSKDKDKRKENENVEPEHSHNESIDGNDSPAQNSAPEQNQPAEQSPTPAPSPTPTNPETPSDDQ